MATKVKPRITAELEQAVAAYRAPGGGHNRDLVNRLAAMVGVGATLTHAYQTAYATVSDQTARKAGARLWTRLDTKARVRELLAETTLSH
jgi:hypothetical protein